jgi:hypothetical protein
MLVYIKKKEEKYILEVYVNKHEEESLIAWKTLKVRGTHLIVG